MVKLSQVINEWASMLSATAWCPLSPRPADSGMPVYCVLPENAGYKRETFATRCADVGVLSAVATATMSAMVKLEREIDEVACWAGLSPLPAHRGVPVAGAFQEKAGHKLGTFATGSGTLACVSIVVRRFQDTKSAMMKLAWKIDESASAVVGHVDGMAVVFVVEGARTPAYFLKVAMAHEMLCK